MKKVIFVLALVLGAGFSVSAQKSAIGLRSADAFGGAEISFQTALGASNRLELDLGNNWHKDYNGYQLTGVYQWMFGLNGLGTGFKWYLGLGATAGTYDANLGLGIVGQVGIEYNFNIPLQISLDWRPTLFNSYYTNYGGNGLSIRYRF